MIDKEILLYGDRVKIQELDTDDILFEDNLFETKYRSSFEELFGNLLFSEKRFRLYIYKVFKREERAERLVKWIFKKFIDLLVEDLIYENDTFKFPRRNILLSVKDANKYRKDWKKYVPSSYGKDYRLFLEKQGQTFFVRLAKPYYKKIIKQGKKQPYL